MAHSARRPRPKFAAPSLSWSCLHKLVAGSARVRGGAGSRRRGSGGGWRGAAGGAGGGPAREGLARGAPLPAGGRQRRRRRRVVAGERMGGARGGARRRRGVVRGAPAGAARGGHRGRVRPGFLPRVPLHSSPSVMFKNRPRFIKLLQPDDLEKMRVPGKFVQEHLTETESCPSSQTAIILSPLSKFWRVELEQGQSDVLFKDGWARFLMAHDLSQGNILVFRYEGNMVFSVEVFLQNGCLKEYNRAGALILTDDPNGPRTGTPQSGKELAVATASKKRKYMKRVVSPNSANKVGSQCKLANTVRKPSFKKQINRYSLKSFLAVKGTFCASIGLVSACTIKLQTSMDSTRSWSVPFNTANTYGYITGPRWKRFCRDNKLKEGDLCTFNVVKTTVWHVVIN